MIRLARTSHMPPSAQSRLSGLARLEAPDIAALNAAMAEARTLRTRRELIGEGHEIGEPRLILDGWAARARILADGRRQLLGFLLPGDVVGLYTHGRPVATSTVVALTDLTYCPAPRPGGLPGLTEAYAVAQALEEAYLLAQITRLGRLNAQERIADLLLELYERLEPTGLVVQRGFDLPLTQEALGDALGLTSVHINRMLQVMRREDDLQLKAGRLVLPDPVALARKIGRGNIRVSALSPARN